MTTSRLLLLATLVVAGACGAYLIWLQESPPSDLLPPSPESGGATETVESPRTSAASDPPPPDPVAPAPYEKPETQQREDASDKESSPPKLKERSLVNLVYRYAGVQEAELRDLLDSKDDVEFYRQVRKRDRAYRA